MPACDPLEFELELSSMDHEGEVSSEIFATPSSSNRLICRETLPTSKEIEAGTPLTFAQTYPRRPSFRSAIDQSVIVFPFLGIFGRINNSSFDSNSYLPDRVGKMRELVFFRLHGSNISQICVQITARGSLSDPANSEGLVFCLRRRSSGKSCLSECNIVPAHDTEKVYLAKIHKIISRINHRLTITISYHHREPQVIIIPFVTINPGSESTKLAKRTAALPRHTLINLTNGETFYLPILNTELI